MPLPPLRMGSKPTSKLSPLPLPKGNELPAESATSTFGEKHASAASSSRESTFGQKHASVASSSGESQLIEPRRFALRYHPPQLIMEYLDSSKGGRVRHRCWKMDKVTNSAHALEAAKQIAEKLATVVRPGSVSVHQVRHSLICQIPHTYFHFPQLDHLLKMLCVNSEKEDEELRVAQEKLADAEMGDFTDKTILTKDLNAVVSFVFRLDCFVFFLST